MLTITVPGFETYDEDADEFGEVGAVTLELEHSLFSLSKWEAFWELPFFSQTEKTTEQVISYIEMMCRTPGIDKDVFLRASQDHDCIVAINKYIESKMTATWFREDPNAPKSREVITSELIYYWMISLTIPLECEHWHINRLFTLIRVFNEKNKPQKKMSRRQQASQRSALNAARRQQYNTHG